MTNLMLSRPGFSLVQSIVQITGTDLSGDDGATDRTYTASSTPRAIFVDGMYLHKDTDFSLSGDTVTFINQIWNEQKIDVWI
jgi:hypothetical protein